MEYMETIHPKPPANRHRRFFFSILTGERITRTKFSKGMKYFKRDLKQILNINNKNNNTAGCVHFRLKYIFLLILKQVISDPISGPCLSRKQKKKREQHLLEAWP